MPAPTSSGRADLDAGKFEPISFCPGYLRGFAFIDRLAIVKIPREHRVPLSPAAIAILANTRTTAAPTDFVFPGLHRGQPLSNMALLMTLKRMGRGDLTTHGFRSSFRDWTAEATDVPREVAEAALAHSINNQVEAAYRRGDLFDKRRTLMEAWGAYCAPAPSATPLAATVRR